MRAITAIGVMIKKSDLPESSGYNPLSEKLGSFHAIETQDCSKVLICESFKEAGGYTGKNECFPFPIDFLENSKNYETIVGDTYIRIFSFFESIGLNNVENIKKFGVWTIMKEEAY